MKTKATGWTPGPWELGKCRDGAAGIWSESGHFADVFYNPEDDDGGELDVEDDHRAMATIRLICAAPEMAELLERNQGIIMNALTSGHGLTPAIMADMREAFAAIRALLAKIKGETNA